uniref:Receptor ligand binding region domain-containing protein n=1 Tax=Aegilops tauschii TaxID=37682 RepID=M8C900_AEGTA
MESQATGRMLAFVSLLTIWSIAVHVSLPAAAAHAPARVGVVVDLTSDVGRKSLTCISKALDGFYLEHPSCAKLVDLRARDSAGEAVKAAHAVSLTL